MNASLFSDQGVSSTLANEFVAGWRAHHPGARITVRDLAITPVPHLTAERFQAFAIKPEERNAAQRADVAHSDALIAELKRADVIVFGMPMYNFDVPSTLKAYFDHVARSGVSFRYTAQGVVGLLTGKKVYVFASRGGYYAGQPKDTQSTYLRTFLGLLGITDIEFVYTEGVAISADSKATALTKARRSIAHLLAAEDKHIPLAA